MTEEEDSKCVTRCIRQNGRRESEGGWDGEGAGEQGRAWHRLAAESRRCDALLRAHGPVGALWRPSTCLRPHLRALMERPSTNDSQGLVHKQHQFPQSLFGVILS